MFQQRAKRLALQRHQIFLAVTSVPASTSPPQAAPAIRLTGMMYESRARW
jgi:hypothetical protein